MNTKSSSTRDEIIKMLKLQKKLTVTDIANQLQITEMAVRRHLNTLERDQFVASTLHRQAMGRPTNVYRLTDKGEELFPRNYRSMTLEFLEDMEDLAGKAMVEELFQRRKERLTNNYMQRMEGKTFHEKVQELVSIQNENGYMVQVERVGEDSYQLKEFNCPISKVAEKYHIACDCELQLFRDILGKADVECRTCMTAGGDVCDYRITKVE